MTAWDNYLVMLVRYFFCFIYVLPQKVARVLCYTLQNVKHYETMCRTHEL